MESLKAFLFFNPYMPMQQGIERVAIKTDEAVCKSVEYVTISELRKAFIFFKPDTEYQRVASVLIGYCQQYITSIHKEGVVHFRLNVPFTKRMSVLLGFLMYVLWRKCLV